MKKLSYFFKNLSLSQRFMLASLIILLLGMVGIGAWVEKQIVIGVIHRTGATTALYIDSFIAPLVQDLDESVGLSSAHMDSLSKLITDSPLSKQIVDIKVWDTRGKLLFSTNTSAIGKTFPMHEGMLRARQGEVVSEISQLDEEENKSLGAVHNQLLETYSPIWLSGTDKVIAIAEFYQVTSELEQELKVLSRRSWLVVGLAILVIYLLLAGFVRDASDMIQRQQAELAQKLSQLTDLLVKNRELSERVRRASASVAQLNEGYLKRIGSELHDGPAQDLGLSILKLDSLASRLEKTERADSEMIDQLNEIGNSLQNALKEIRGIATGLSLPQLTELNLEKTIKHVVSVHERRTGSRVELSLEPLPSEVSLPIRITIYRLIQEALNNAIRHAGGDGQRVRVKNMGDKFIVLISDNGPGFDPSLVVSTDHLGLSGMRERVESLGGWFEIDSRSGQGTTIIVRMPYELDGDSKI